MTNMEVKLEKDTLVIRLPVKVPNPLRVLGLPRFVAGTAKVQRTKLKVAGNNLYVVANAFICPAHETTAWKGAETSEAITPKMHAARKALEERERNVKNQDQNRGRRRFR